MNLLVVILNEMDKLDELLLELSKNQSQEELYLTVKVWPQH